MIESHVIVKNIPDEFLVTRANTVKKQAMRSKLRHNLRIGGGSLYIVLIMFISRKRD